MKTHRYRCFGPAWPFRYAYAYGYGTSADRGRDRDRTDEDATPWQEHRGHQHWKSGRRSGSFGVRRPLRYLSYQLDLDESQRRRIAVALDAVKTEREQAALDEKKMAADLADLVAKPEFTDEALNGVLSARVTSTDRVQKQVARAIRDIAAALDPDQREEFAYLLRTGAIQI
ncbi:MAG: periplasmic heavy metal sensor [Pseudomonadales bacterium]